MADSQTEPIILPKFFRLMSTDECPFFEPVSLWAGMWSGVAKVEDEEEAVRLISRGCSEISAQEYDSSLKKKAQQQSQSQDFRPVFPASAVPPVENAKPAPPPAPAVRIDNPPASTAAQKPAPQPEAPTLAQLTSAVPIPPRGRRPATSELIKG